MNIGRNAGLEFGPKAEFRGAVRSYLWSEAAPWRRDVPEGPVIVARQFTGGTRA